MNLFFISAFIIGYLLYEGIEADYARHLRKNPADYANDE